MDGLLDDEPRGAKMGATDSVILATLETLAQRKH